MMDHSNISAMPNGGEDIGLRAARRRIAEDLVHPEKAVPAYINACYPCEGVRRGLCEVVFPTKDTYIDLRTGGIDLAARFNMNTESEEIQVKVYGANGSSMRTFKIEAREPSVMVSASDVEMLVDTYTHKPLKEAKDLAEEVLGIKVM